MQNKFKKPDSQNIYRDKNGYYFIIRMKNNSVRDKKYFETLELAKNARDKFREKHNLPKVRKYITEFSNEELKYIKKIDEDTKNYRSSIKCFACDKKNNKIVLCNFCDNGYHMGCHDQLQNINSKYIGNINFFCSKNCEKQILFNNDKDCELCNSPSNNVVPIICQAIINEFFNNSSALEDINKISLCDLCNEIKINLVDKEIKENIDSLKSYDENISLSKNILINKYKNIISDYFIKENPLSKCENDFLLKKQNNQCNICDTKLIYGNIENDHIITKKINGSNCIINRQYLCCSCHRTIKTKIDSIFNSYFVNANNFNSEENIDNISKIKNILKSDITQNMINEISFENNKITKEMLNRKFKIYILEKCK